MDNFVNSNLLLNVILNFAVFSLLYKQLFLQNYSHRFPHCLYTILLLSPILCIGLHAYTTFLSSIIKTTQFSGYYADDLSIAQEVRGNHTVRVKNESRGFHLNNLSYAGPIVMGVGGNKNFFLKIFSCLWYLN